MFPSARFIQTVAPFEGRGRLGPTALGESATYRVPPEKRAQLVYPPGGELKVFLGAPLGATGTLVLDIGIVEVA